PASHPARDEPHGTSSEQQERRGFGYGRGCIEIDVVERDARRARDKRSRDVFEAANRECPGRRYGEQRKLRGSGIRGVEICRHEYVHLVGTEAVNARGVSYEEIQRVEAEEAVS